MDEPRRRRPRKPARQAGLKVEQKGGRWHAYGTVRAGDKSRRVRRSLGLAASRPRAEAEAAARAFETQVIDELLYGKQRSATFAHACKRYLNDRAREHPDGWRDPEAPRVVKFLTELQHTRLGELTTPMLQGTLTRLCGHTSAESQARQCNTLGAILGAAQRHGLMDAVPKIPRPRHSSGKTKIVNKWLYPEEIALFLECLPEHIRLPVKIMFMQGRRPSEILYRDWSDLKLRAGAETLYLGVTKTGVEQSIPLDREIVEDLKALASARLAAGMALEGGIFLTSYGKPWQRPEGCFENPIGKPVRIAREKAAKRLEAMALEAGVDREHRDWLRERAAVMRTVTAYWGRHNFVSHHVINETPPLAIARLVGWSSLAMLPRYGHLADGHLREAMAKVRVTGGKK